MSPAQLEKIALAMMEYSFYAREAELSQGFFTLRNGCRAGVCGEFRRSASGGCMLASIGSLCIRIAREVRGCAEALTKAMLEGGRPVNTLLLSRPGMGKTTLLRDAARLLSGAGYAVGIADERHEIAACVKGVPTMDVGERTDVADGLTKAAALEMLMRTMSPEILITDEVGSEEDIRAIREAARRGAAILTSAHAGSMADLEYAPLDRLACAGIFALIVLLDGKPGEISEIRRVGRQ